MTYLPVTGCKIINLYCASRPLTTTYPAEDYVGFNQSVALGSPNATILSTTSGIVDTGTTLLLIASGQLRSIGLCASSAHVMYGIDAFATYQNSTGAVLDDATGLLTINSTQFDNLQSLFFNIGNVSLSPKPESIIDIAFAGDLRVNPERSTLAPCGKSTQRKWLVLY